MSVNLSKRTTEEVLEHHIRTLGAGELEEVLLDYTEDSCLINMNGVVKGLDALRDFFKDSIENCLPPDTDQTFEVRRTDGKLAYVVWRAESQFFHVPFGTDTFVVENGHIVMQTFAGIMQEV